MKKRLDQILVDQGLVETRSQAKAMIMAGQVLVGDERIDKAGTLFPEDVKIRLKEKHPFVSRGGLKLKKALDSFGVSVTDQIFLDVGASTGGFTDCLLQSGAKKVYAIDVGTHQLHWKLQNDPRVISHEKTHFLHFDLNQISDPIAGAVMDVSFISCKRLIPKIVELFEKQNLENPFLITLIKPQFEVGKKNIGKGGIVRDENVRKKVVQDIKEFCSELGFQKIQITESPITGQDGNHEYLLFGVWGR